MELPDNFSTMVENLRKRVIADNRSVLEIEARPIPSIKITVAQFYRAVELISAMLPCIEQVREDDYITDMDGKRRQRSRQRLDKDGRIVTELIIKENFFNTERLKHENFGIRIGVSSEQTLDVPATNNPVTIVRRHTRMSYKNPATPYRFDLSIVMTDGVAEPSYEIELELTEITKESLSGFKAQLRLLFFITFESNLPYSLTERNNIFRTVNTKIGGGNIGSGLDNGALTQARNMNIADLVAGGIVPLPSKTTPPMLVTPKADGNRRLLYLDEDGCWLLGAPNTLNLVSRWSGILKPSSEWMGSVWEGEEIPIQNRRNGMVGYRGLYMVIDDCLYVEGVPNMRQRNISDPSDTNLGSNVPTSNTTSIVLDIENGRASFINKFTNDMDPQSKLLMVSAKAYYKALNTNDFFEKTRAILDKIDALPYVTDGLIFTPDAPYMPTGTLAFRRGGGGVPPRLLTTYTDILKWKPEDLNTFDLLYKDGKLWANDKGTLVEFHPTELKAEDLRDHVKDGEMGHPKARISDGVIYEIGWNKLYQAGVVHRPRYNKKNPNDLRVAEDAWSLAHNPIPANTLQGIGLLLMRRYHNREKRSLLAQGSGILLDLGAGKGGDLTKQNHYSKIIAIEPDEDNRNEYLRRLAELETAKKNPVAKNKFLLFPGKAQDTEAIMAILNEYIPGGKVDTISMMMSLTFLFENDAVLKRLINTIDHALAPNGSFLVTVFDGDLVKAAVNYGPTADASFPLSSSAPGSPTWVEGKRLVFPLSKNETLDDIPTIIVGNDNHTVSIKLPGSATVAESQVEYLTDMTMLTDLLAKIGLNLAETYRLDGELFLNPVENALSRLYSAWRFVRGPVGLGPTRPTPTPAPQPVLQKAPLKVAVLGKPVPISQPAPAITPVTSTQPPVIQIKQAPQFIIPPAALQPTRVSPPVPQIVSQAPQFTISPAIQIARMSPSVLQTIPQAPQFKISQPDYCYPLAENKTQEFKTSDFPDEQFRRIGSSCDRNNCMIHSILRAFDPKYQSLIQDPKGQDNYVAQIRTGLAGALTPELYDELYTIKSLDRANLDPETLKEYSREQMVNELLGKVYLGGPHFIDFFSTIFRVDIYIFTCEDNIKLLTVSAPENTLYKRRYAIMLYYTGNHYEAVEVKRGNEWKSSLSPNDPLNQELYRRSTTGF